MFWPDLVSQGIDKNVSFVHPERLWLLAGLGLLSLWMVRGALRRRRDWASLAQRGRAPRDGTFWLLTSAFFLVIAIAQPRWGRLGSPRSPGHDVVLMIDVSRSMGAEDAVPNRLAVAVESAEKLVDALAPEPANRVSVVAFSGRGVRRCPLTENLGAVVDTLHRLRPGVVQPGGTDLGAGLDAALEAMGTDEHSEGQAIVVFSDGEDLADQWRSRLDRLRERRVVVHAVTIGDAEKGHTIPVPSGAGGVEKPLVYRGEPVLSRRSDTSLEAIAQETGGMLIRLGLASTDLGTLYRTRIEPAARRHREFLRISDLTDQFSLFLGAALTCLLAGCWSPSRGWAWRDAWAWRTSAKSLGRVSLAIGLGVVICGAGRPPGLWSKAGSWWEPIVILADNPGPRISTDADTNSASALVDRGRAFYEAGQFAEALKAFDAAARLAPNAAVPHYNAAAVAFRVGQFDSARKRYLDALPLADAALRTKIEFAMGNTALALGDIPAAIAAYDACIASTARGTGLDLVRKDAVINREFAYKQAQSPAMPQGEGSDEPSSSQRRERKKSSDRRSGNDPRSEDAPDTGPSSGGSGPEDDPERSADRNRPHRKRRRAGDAGGSQSIPPDATGETPEDRLDSALANIRNAQSRRISEEQPPTKSNDDQRDW